MNMTIVAMLFFFQNEKINNLQDRITWFALNKLKHEKKRETFLCKTQKTHWGSLKPSMQTHYDGVNTFAMPFRTLKGQMGGRRPNDYQNGTSSEE